MSEMFCFQCEQTAGGKGCTKSGVCGKKPGTAMLQDMLVGELVALAGGEGFTRTPELDTLVENALFTTLTNVNFDDLSLAALVEKVRKIREESGVADAWDMNRLWTASEDVRSLKSLLLFGMKGIAAYASHARVLGRSREEVTGFLYRGLALLAADAGKETLLDAVLEAGKVNLACMELLNDANRTYGTPEPVAVSPHGGKGPLHHRHRHDLHDLALLLRQTEGKGVNVYTHGEMLPAHAYPELKKYAHFKGHFRHGLAEPAEGIRRRSRARTLHHQLHHAREGRLCRPRVHHGVVRFPGMVNIDENKDFSPVIARALELGGYAEDKCFPGINGGETMTTGFGSEAVLSHAGTIVEAVKAGAIRHFFLVGGCDGARPGRNYYTEFVKQTPADTWCLPWPAASSASTISISATSAAFPVFWIWDSATMPMEPFRWPSRWPEPSTAA